MGGEKVCTKCDVCKPLDEYHKQKGARDGLRSACKECTRAQLRVYAAANRQNTRDRANKWREENRQQHRNYSRAWRASNLERARAADRARYTENRDQRREAARKRYMANRERRKESSRAWRAANPDKRRSMHHRRRARKGCGVPQRWRVHEIIPFACYWCGANLRAYGANSHVDHVLPIALGGPADQTNEVSTCSDCNIRKGAKHPLVWIAELVAR